MSRIVQIDCSCGGHVISHITAYCARDCREWLFGPIHVCLIHVVFVVLVSDQCFDAYFCNLTAQSSTTKAQYLDLFHHYQSQSVISNLNLYGYAHPDGSIFPCELSLLTENFDLINKINLQKFKRILRYGCDSIQIVI